MGTNMAFLFIQNKGLARDALAQKMQSVTPRGPSPLSCFARGLDPNQRLAQDAPGNPSRNPFLAYASEARWLPYFDEGLCMGGILDERDLNALSNLFGAPILAFSIYDSDAVELFFCDAQTRTTYDYGTSLCPGMIDFEDGCSQACPLFLAGLLGVEEAQIQAAWNQEDLVFADDIMTEILEIMGAPAVFDASEDLSGYEKLYTGD